MDLMESERHEIIRKILVAFPHYLSVENHDLLYDRLNVAISCSRFAQFKQLESKARLNPFIRGERLMTEIEKLVSGTDIHDQECFDEFSYFVFLFCSSKYRRIRWSTVRWIRKMVKARSYYPGSRLTYLMLNSYKDDGTKPPSVLGFGNVTIFGEDLLDGIDLKS